MTAAQSVINKRTCTDKLIFITAVNFNVTILPIENPNSVTA